MLQNDNFDLPAAKSFFCPRQTNSTVTPTGKFTSARSLPFTNSKLTATSPRGCGIVPLTRVSLFSDWPRCGRIATRLKPGAAESIPCPIVGQQQLQILWCRRTVGITRRHTALPLWRPIHVIPPGQLAQRAVRLLMRIKKREHRTDSGQHPFDEARIVAIPPVIVHHPDPPQRKRRDVLLLTASARGSSSHPRQYANR
jgi:hypothetical protein